MPKICAVKRGIRSNVEWPGNKDVFVSHCKNGVDSVVYGMSKTGRVGIISYLDWLEKDQTHRDIPHSQAGPTPEADPEIPRRRDTNMRRARARGGPRDNTRGDGACRRNRKVRERRHNLTDKKQEPEQQGRG